jgi:hypothetical protein
MIGIPVGLATAEVAEWLIHKHILHGQGRKRGSFWSFHWYEHHTAALKNSMYDPDYQRSPFGWHAQGKEVLGLCMLGVPALIAAPVAPFFAATLVYCGVNYYRCHKRAHMDPEWARQHLPWHYDHHMGPDQDANWGVTRPWVDVLVGTRKPYVGTEEEAGDHAARNARAAG